MTRLHDYFYALADTITPILQGEEVFTCNFSGETSDFVRFNHTRVRQAGTITQRGLTLDLIAGKRHASGGLTLSGEFDVDRARLVRMIDGLREKRAQLPEDPFLLYATEVHSGERQQDNRLPQGADVLGEIERAGRGRDLVGIYAAGGTYAGFANSLGQRNWHAGYSYNLDWSFHLDGDKAVKAAYGGFEWETAEFERKVELAGEQLSVLSRSPHRLSPGRYRVYLAPAAMAEILELLSWGAFSLRAHRSKTTPLLRMIEADARLHPQVGIVENTRQGIAPDFQDAGFIRPDQVILIGEGQYRDCLVSPRSSAEYGVPTNGASSMESPQSVEIGAGRIGRDAVLRELQTGIYVSNLWYMNYSDRSACRTTGMTRFATFWVENGVIQRPLSVMRFDETIYRMFGDNLLGLTTERDMIFDPDTYSRRSTRSARLPGALVEDFTFTL